MKLLITGLLLAIAGSNSIHSSTFPLFADADLSIDTGKNQLRDQLPSVNINHMVRGHFYASSPLVEELAGAGGWGGSDNNFRKVDETLPVNKNGFEVYIDTTKTTDLGNGFAAFNVYVINTAGDTVFFEAQDSRLYMTVQALDKSGEWKPIEYLPNSWCGNSYHKLFLPSGAYWQFKTPVFEGRYKTSLRISLSYKNDPEGKSEIVYSNVIKAKINPGQFWRKKKYNPNGIMDPYLE